MAYEGVSIVDFLRSTGQSSDYASRSQLAASKGISGYTGSAQQNTLLLNMLRGGGTGAPIVPQPATTPQSQPQPGSSMSQVQGTGGGDTELQQLAKTDRNPVQETRYQELLRQQQSSVGTPGQIPVFNQPSINLPELYQGLYDKSEIKGIEEELSSKSRAYTEQVAKIKDNPYLSEATMTGRLSKLQDKFNADTANIRSDIATRKADIETQLNIQTKQFDINSQQAQQAFQQFNSLLGAGALDSASGEDIASITRATGIPSSIIQSAIGVSRKGREKKLDTQVIQSTNDSGVVTVSVVNADTGEVINQTSLGAIGNVQRGRQATETEKKMQYVNLLKEDAGRGATLAQIFSIYSGYLDPNDILNLYNVSSMFGPAKESEAELKKYGVKPISSGTSTTEDLIRNLQN